jgi:hypothetical protein
MKSRTECKRMIDTGQNVYEAGQDTKGLDRTEGIRSRTGHKKIGQGRMCA